MTRKEEIQKLIDEEMGIDNYGSSDYQIGVCDGVRLADRTMIEKTTQWFKDRFYNGGMHLLEEPNGGYREAYDICCGFESIQEMVIDFLNAMEE